MKVIAYIIKSKENIKLLFVLLFLDFIIGKSISIFPASVEFRIFKILPVGLINALIPLFADLKV